MIRNIIGWYFSKIFRLLGGRDKSVKFVFVFCSKMVYYVPWNSQCRPGWLLSHRYSPTSASQMLGLKEYATTSGPFWILGMHKIGTKYTSDFRFTVEF